MGSLQNPSLAWVGVGRQEDLYPLSSSSSSQIFVHDLGTGPLKEDEPVSLMDSSNADFRGRTSSGQIYWIAEAKAYKDSSRKVHRNRSEVLSILEKLRAKSVIPDRSKLEAKWLSVNRQRYAGEWIALQGDRLLARAPSAREIFQTVRDMFPKPLVMQVEDDEVPFAGW